MVWQLILLGAASLAASAVLFSHRRLLTFLAAAGVVWEAHVLLLTWVERFLWPSLETAQVFTVGAVAAAVIWFGLAWARNRRALTRLPRPARGDLAVLAVMVIALTAAWLIQTRNGFENSQWVTHGFYNGDVATFMALTQRSMLTGDLLSANPLAGNGSLEYPSLLHGAVANVWNLLGVQSNWPYLLSTLVYWQIFLTVPIFFLIWDIVFPETEGRWLVMLGQGAIVLYVMGLSWDNYVYPQSHFFLMGLFLLLAALLIASARGDWKKHLAPLGAAAAITLVLLFSNAVTGTAAVALKILFDGLQARRRGISMLERFGWLAGAAFWVVMFLAFTPGNGSLGLIPGFSYTAAAEMGRLALPVLLLLAGVFARYEREDFMSVSVLAFSALAVATFIFSSRGIIVENSSRFFYHALLIGFPLMLSPMIRLTAWFRREILLSTRSWEQMFVGWGAALVMVFLGLLPMGASVASVHDNLMFKDERRVTTGMREALWWIEEHTPPHAIFVANPEAPFAVPIFTGRAMLRSDIWLSPEDIVSEDLKAAFAGNKAAQEKVVTQADYLLLKQSEREAWEPLPLEKVFDINSVVIYQLK